MALYADGPNRGQLTPWQPQAPGNGIPIFDIKVAGNGMLFGAGGGAGGRAVRWDPQDRLRRHQLQRPRLDAPVRR